MNGWSEHCVCMYACYYSEGGGGGAWMVVADERCEEIFLLLRRFRQGRAAATPLNADG